jgi:retinol-binding protein 3
MPHSTPRPRRSGSGFALSAAFLIAAGLCLPIFARAQIAAPSRPSQPDRSIDAAARKAVVDTLCDRIERYYVFPDRARAASQAIRKRYQRHEYDRITSAGDFADSLTAHLRAAVHDLHLRVHYRYEPIPVQAADGPPPESERRAIAEQERFHNYGFERVERLPGNVGYLDLRQFSDDPEAQATAVAAMNFLAHTDALIVDLRRNGGGSPEMIATLITYLTEAGDRLLFNTFYKREGNTTEQYWTSPYVPGARYVGKPVYVLTSNRTGSAAEEFAYDVQTHKLGTVVGSTSAGGANPGDYYRLSENFAAFIATGRAVNPVTHTNWEGVGVKPDSSTTAGEALRAAYEMALHRLQADAKDDRARLQVLDRALADAAQRAPDPEQDFARPGTMR